MALTPVELLPKEAPRGCGRPLENAHRGCKPVLAACAPPGTYPPAPTCPGDEMRWHCHGANYEELVSNLQSSSRTRSDRRHQCDQTVTSSVIRQWLLASSGGEFFVVG
jgi:hypothetical protein